ncbi:hypothetical protein N7452_000513 [Penicillium brevicompactum]|uniref:Uncharacterized protein n=1 Tax=Penicillium brevicompactum TaxID=5074 RepID=A0A9W9R2U1_PENBR|nr:hypothetical protein N7452_000513 [Penicillium brevicompactum]
MSVYALQGKVALVTGAGSGIGHAVAKLLLEVGCSVVFADLSLQPAAKLTLEKHAVSMDEKPPSAIFQKTDVADWSQLNDLWNTTLEKFGQVDLVANIAGVYDPPFSDFWKPPGVSPESKDAPDANPGTYATISINYVAPVRLSQLAIDYWCRNPHIKGNFLAVSSVAAYLHMLSTPLYMSSKAALVSFVKSLGALNDYFGIRVAAVCPSGVMTPLLENKINDKVSAEGSLTPEECAGVILRVLQEAQWGRGSIVETHKLDTEEPEGKVAVRDVDLELLYPNLAFPDNIARRIGEDEQNLVARLEDRGMQP